jgi:hypothetical protein
MSENLKTTAIICLTIVICVALMSSCARSTETFF